MNPEQFRELINRIAQNMTNQALVTELLTQATDAFDTTHTSLTGLQTRESQLNTQITDLQKTNMNLFLRVTEPQTQKAASEALQQEGTLSYEDLIKTLEGDNK